MRIALRALHDIENALFGTSLGINLERGSLAERGHEVSLFDSAREVGGQFNMAKRIPGKEEFHESLRYFAHRIEDTGVALRLNRHERGAVAFGALEIDDGGKHSWRLDRILAQLEAVVAQHLLNRGAGIELRHHGLARQVGLKSNRHREQQ